MTEQTIAPYGSWASPFPIERLVDGVVFLGEARGIGGARWWLEGRPDEAGRQVLVRRDRDGLVARMTPEGFNVRSRVHEYGGAATLVSGDLVVVSDFVTGRLHRVTAPGVLTPITPDRPWRFADMNHDAARGRLYAVRERHDPELVAEHGEWVNDIVTIDLATGEVESIVAGADFYAAPRLSPDGRTLAWLEWRHPNLPWDGTELKLAAIGAGGELGPGVTVAGSPSAWTSQPRWSPSGVLHFAAEPDGWMNLFRFHAGSIEPIAPLAVEFAPPDWLFGNATYGFLPDGGILAVGRSGGRDRLYRIAPDGAWEVLDLPYTEIGSVSIDGDGAVMRAVSPLEPAVLVELSLTTGALDVIRRATPFIADRADVSEPRHVEFPTTGGRTAFANYYAPHNRRFRAPDGEQPPLIVTSHGGPTAAAFAGWATGIQLFASRGYAVLDVDYGGSTGYGRDYRKVLEGEWGVVDVDDCVAGAEWLVAQGLADPARLAIRGGSASGFTTLAALAFRRTFSAGTTYFGLGNLRAFVKDTHKFESRYLERLVGPWPETEQRYVERSPSLHADRIVAPVLVEQGAEDRVVPPSEAERIVDALWERRVPHAYLLFPGEDHGFRGREAIVRSFGAELSFYGQVFGFTPADEIEPLKVVFLDDRRAERS
ncbi:MAG TPA: prolyl oligopeptidase family serine peptidase [Candidatus Sulfomarinibacteraceae bacterium]|nr:prolyl oligopeptidase family serine peptidase [Candidatus Sulfomarinibacteraceae bacterium]